MRKKKIIKNKKDDLIMLNEIKLRRTPHYYTNFTKRWYE